MTNQEIIEKCLEALNNAAGLASNVYEAEEISGPLGEVINALLDKEQTLEYNDYTNMWEIVDKPWIVEFFDYDSSSTPFYTKTFDSKKEAEDFCKRLEISEPRIDED